VLKVLCLRNRRDQTIFSFIWHYISALQMTVKYVICPIAFEHATDHKDSLSASLGFIGFLKLYCLPAYLIGWANQLSLNLLRLENASVLKFHVVNWPVDSPSLWVSCLACVREAFM
jgi:hypothetical protein